MIPLECVESIDSTSEALKRGLADPNLGERALMARQQTSGRGRLGRRWESPPGNLYLSVLLWPPSVSAPGHWSLLAGVALADAVSPHVSPSAALRLKWPNDLMLKDAKLAGILIDAGRSPSPWLIVGIGLNLLAPPSGLDRHTAGLAGEISNADALLLAQAILTSLDHWRDRYLAEGFAPVRKAWLRYGPSIGDAVRSSHGAGRFAGLADDGALLLEEGEQIRSIVTGEIW